MLKLAIRRPLFAAGLALALALMPAALRAAPAGDDKDKTASPAEKLKKQLDQTISLDIADQTLTLAINQIREQTKINFVVDKLTLQQMGLDPDQFQVNAKLKEVKVRTALRSVLAPYNLGYAIIGDTILISTDDLAMARQMKQRVNIDLEKEDLAAALKKLAKETATNLMLDTRAAKEAKAEVSMQMDDVPLETAVRLMAEIAGLKPVRVGNVLFVTTKALANELRSDPDLNGTGGIPGGPGYPPPGVMPGNPGFPVPPGGIAPNVPAGLVPGVGTATAPAADPPAVEKPVEEKKPVDEAKPVEDKGKPEKSDPKPDAPKKDKEG